MILLGMKGIIIAGVAFHLNEFLAAYNEKIAAVKL
jgi:hypothetical protein